MAAPKKDLEAPLLSTEDGDGDHQRHPASFLSVESGNTNQATDQPARSKSESLKDLDDRVCDVRTSLYESNQMVVGTLCYAAMKHAAESITHTDHKIRAIAGWCTTPGKVRNACANGGQMARDVKGWLLQNKLKTFLMFLGFGLALYKSKTIKTFMSEQAKGYIEWSQSVSRTKRFLGFCALMTLRLFVSTLVPPTSPAFSIIIAEATPGDEKWTAMPFFLGSATVAGVMPYLLDKLLQILTCCRGDSRGDFKYTMFMKWFAELWPLTCWTPPLMMKVFEAVEAQSGEGAAKLGASAAVIFAHSAPFMGAQTTNLQRYFLPHPLDTIISQPFGMTEDLITMAMDEALSHPSLASNSLNYIVWTFNFSSYFVFTGGRDLLALVCGLLNIFVGLGFRSLMANYMGKQAFMVVGVQLFAMMFLVPFLASLLGGKSELQKAQDKACNAARRAPPSNPTSATQPSAIGAVAQQVPPVGLVDYAALAADKNAKVEL